MKASFGTVMWGSLIFIVLLIGVSRLPPVQKFLYPEPELIVRPRQLIQGEPLLITVAHAGSAEAVKSIRFNGTSLPMFFLESQPTALVGFSLSAKTGAFPIEVNFADGRVATSVVTIAIRKKIEAPLGIPEKLGGNTPDSQKQLVSSLAKDNAALNALTSSSTTLWHERFQWPLPHITITDPYGYSRQTGDYDITHGGTDFRAAEGTPVTAMNAGRVLLASESRTYGNTVVIDHGHGLMIFYMHLSRIDVKVGQSISRGQIIALSGQTGYAEGAHLHVTVRVGSVAIDPMKFMMLVGEPMPK